LLGRVQETRRKKILELGSGQGRDTIYFASKGMDVIAIDSSQVAYLGITAVILSKETSIKAVKEQLG
jgi:cyclopropane fatty-acyl-phospholipid synthase-like methyltransferase